MWQETFRALAQKKNTLESILLNNRIPLMKKNGERMASSIMERTSSVLASRLPLSLNSSEKRRLIFFVPNATQSLGQFLTVSLLLADFVHRFDPRIPSDEKGALVKGDLLLVTQHIRECVSLLREVSVSNESLSKYWTIEVFSQYSPPFDDKPRVFVANPGWLGTPDIQRKFFSVIIDASHPRTLDNLESLLRDPNIESALVQIFVLPPCESERIQRLYKDKDVFHIPWVWDPAAVKALEQIFSPTYDMDGQTIPERFIWLSKDDAVNCLLAELHGLLTEAMRLCGGRAPGRLLEAWSVYHRLRQLAVPLVLLEEKRQQAYKTLTLSERIQILETEPPSAYGELSLFLDARWPRIVEILKAIYKKLLEYREPAKFYTLASVIQEQLHKLDKSEELSSIRIVTPTIHEEDILTTLLGEIVDGWIKALQKGRVFMTTVREEPRLIAAGQNLTTILLGFRTSDSRYLDIYPEMPVHMIAYPFEAEIDEAIQRRVYHSMEQFQKSESRLETLQVLRLPLKVPMEKNEADSGGKTPYSPRAKILIFNETGRTIKQLEKRSILDDLVEPLDISKLAGLTWTDEIVIEAAAGKQSITNNEERRKQIEYVEITLSTGERIRYPSSRLINVYYPATGIKERIPTANLKPGRLIVILVDDPYEDVFERLIESINAHRNPSVLMALKLWQHAKKAALIKAGGNRQKLHQLLSEQGLSVEYAAVVGWYAEGEDERNPLKQADFQILARFSGLYTEPTLMEATFRYINKERVNRRNYGKRLIKLLAQIAAGQNYEAALKSSKVIGTPLEQLAAAVSLKEVEAIRKLGTISDM